MFNKSNNKSPVIRGVILAVLLGLVASPVIAKDVYLVAKPVDLTMPDSSVVTMWGYAVDADSNLATDDAEVATVPGPQIEVLDGTLNIHLRNDLAVPTSIGIAGQKSAAAPVLEFFTDGLGRQRIHSFDTETVPSLVSCGPAVASEDLNGNGVLDLNLSEDLNTNSILDPGEDLNGNGLLDLNLNEDLNGNGVLDLATAVVDCNIQTYSWSNVEPGTYLYGSVTHIQVQRQMGLYGAMTKNVAAGEAYPGKNFDTESLLVYSEIDPALHEEMADNNQLNGSVHPGMTSTINYNPKYFLINGVHRKYSDKVADGALILPETETLAPNETMLIRFVNAGLRTAAPMFLGARCLSIADDGNPYPYARNQYTVDLWAGSTRDCLLTPSSEGTFPIMERRTTGMADGGQLAFVTVNSVVGAPTAVNDAYAVNEDATLDTVAALLDSVLVNDTDPNSLSLTASLVSDVSNGALTLNSIDGSFSYTPNADFNGLDSFTYQAFNGASLSSVATVTITVAPAQDVPIAMNDAYNALAKVQTSISIPGVLLNDVDIDGDALTATSVGYAGPGTLIANADGSFVYTPAVGAVIGSTDSFTYFANDGTANSPASATVTLTVVNATPVAVSDTDRTNENLQLVVAAPGVLGNDTDANGDVLTAELVSGPSHGSLTLDSVGSFTYTPAMDFNGLDSFTYVAKDGRGLPTSVSNVATMTITVVSMNSAPVAVNDGTNLAPFRTTPSETPIIITAAEVLVNDSDIDNAHAGLSVIWTIGATANGNVSANGDGSAEYQPNAGFQGVDTFTYMANDGLLNSLPATVFVNVEAPVPPPNIAPVAADDAVILPPGNLPGIQSVTINVVLNDTDEDGTIDPTTVVITSNPNGNINAVNHGDGTITLTRTNNSRNRATRSFSYTVKDNLGAVSNVATVDIQSN